MICLILGGTGVMGRHLVKLLEEDNHDVYVTSRKKIDSTSKTHYLTGNARDDGFLKYCVDEISKQESDKIDVIVDFMSYKTDEFAKKVDFLLNNTRQYIYLSSSRVYADAGKEMITENSNRLLDIIEDEVYLATDEYALTKARQENLLCTNKKRNWTIVRPYITFDSERLQLGGYEKEQWLQRAVKGKPIVFSKDIASKYTTLAYGEDVSRCIFYLMNNDLAIGEIFHIAGNKPIQWQRVLDIYTNVLERYLKKPVPVIYTETAAIAEEQKYQYKYDRLYNRIFDNTKLFSVIGNQFEFIDVEEALRISLESFLEGKQCFRYISPKSEAILDRSAKIVGGLSIFPLKGKVRYLWYRYIKV